jgi:hypothetical protein
MRNIFLAAVLLAGGACPVVASAEPVGTFVLIGVNPDLDFVVDDSRKFIYFAVNGAVYRWDMVTKTTLMPPIDTSAPTGGGIDISPDSKHLVVADVGVHNVYPEKIRVRVIDLDTLQVSKFETPAQYPEVGTYGVAFGSNDIVYVGGVPSGPLRKLDLRTGAWTTVRNYTPYRAFFNHSPDYSAIYFSGADTGASDTPIVRLDTATGQQTEILADRGLSETFGHDSAGRFVAGGYDAYVFDADFNEIAWPGDWGYRRPHGPGAISPVEDILYLSTDRGTVDAYDMATGKTLGSYDIGQSTFYRSGRIRMSRDGSLMVVSVAQGLQVVQLYEPLTAENLTVYSRSGEVKSVKLPGSIGIDAPLVYAIDRQPLHGTVRLSGAVATYKPSPGYLGSDSFGYTVSLKGATAKGWVRLRVAPAGRVHIDAHDSTRPADGKKVANPVRGSFGKPNRKPLPRKASSTEVRP